MNKINPKYLQFQKLALERIERLFELAQEVFNKEPKLSDRYVAIARRISMKYKIKIPLKLKRRFCKNCFSYLMPSVNCRIRTQRGKVVYYCLNCKKYIRFPYIREKKERRKAKLNPENSSQK